jgi:hypothetical protein
MALLWSGQGVTKRSRLSWLTNSSLVYEPKWGGWGGGGFQPMSSAVHMEPNYCKLWRSNHLTPYLPYGCGEGRPSFSFIYCVICTYTWAALQWAYNWPFLRFLFLFQRANAAAMLRKWCCTLALLTFIPLAFYISIQMDASQGTKVTKIWLLKLLWPMNRVI